VKILGSQAWEWKDADAPAPGSSQFAANGAFLDNLKYADRDKERTFIESITSGKSHNQIAGGVETALSCMLGRMAGYTHREVTWDELLANGETYELGMDIAQFALGCNFLFGCRRHLRNRATLLRLAYRITLLHRW
jgi:hypothetical protein